MFRGGGGFGSGGFRPDLFGGGGTETTTDFTTSSVTIDLPQEDLAQSCFPAATLVSTETGLRPIESVRTGDRVWAFDHAVGEWMLQRVLECYESTCDSQIIAISVAGEVIEATLGHPFWVIEGRALLERPQPEHVPAAPEKLRVPGRWVDAGDLQIGDVLLLKEERFATVKGWKTRPAREKVYNFQVEELHCYAVGAKQVLVHNNSALVDPSGMDDRRDRPDRRREERERRGTSGSDAQGDFILNHWLDGSGEEVDLFYDQEWTNYMRANKLLQNEALEQLKKDALTRKESGPVSIRFPGEMENGYATGYQLLHGSKGIANRGKWKGQDQGDVQMVGYATVVKKPDGKVEIRYGLNTTWNDIIDPNPKYRADTILSVILHIFYSPQDYKIKIRWSSGTNVEVNGTNVTGKGWPFDSNQFGNGRGVARDFEYPTDGGAGGDF